MAEQIVLRNTGIKFLNELLVRHESPSTEQPTIKAWLPAGKEAAHSRGSHAVLQKLRWTSVRRQIARIEKRKRAGRCRPPVLGSCSRTFSGVQLLNIAGKDAV